jgi:hypothetical protein
MPFDPTSAVPLKPRFDPSTAALPSGPSPYAEVIAEARQPDPIAAAIQSGEGGTLSTDNPAVYRPSTAGKLALRVGFPLAVGVGTAGAGLIPAMIATGLTGAATEAAAQGLEIAGDERTGLSFPQIGASGLLNAVPGIPLTRVASPLGRGAIRVAEGAGLGAAYPVLESGLRGELPQLGDVGTGALYGGAFGVPFGAVEAGSAIRAGQLRNASILPRITSPEIPAELGAMVGRANEPIAPILSTNITPTEVNVVGPLLREPMLPAASDIVPTELGAVAGQRAAVFPERRAQQQIGERAVETMDAAIAADEAARANQIDSAKVQALAERMAGKSPQDQLAILDQEMKLQGDTLSLAEQRAGLDTKILLKQQIEAQKAMEQAATAQQKMQAEAASAVEAAAQPVEVPKSTQILQDAGKPKSIANVAAEVGTNTSPYALQGQLNAMTQAPTPELPAGPRDATVSTGTGEPTPVEQTMLTEQKALVDEYLAKPTANQFSRSVMNALVDEDAFLKATPKITEAIERMPNELRNALVEVDSQNKSMAQSREVLDDDIVAELQANRKTPAKYAEAVKWLNEFKPTEPVPGKPPEATRLASTRRSQRGAFNPSAIASPLGAVAGAAYGATQGETPDERIKNAALYGSLGLGAGLATSSAIARLSKAPVRKYTSPVLKDVAQMLTPKEESTSLFSKLGDEYEKFRYRFNTRYAPIGEAQRGLFKENGRKFVPNAYYDLERGFERLAGAPVQAEGEVELLQGVLDKLPKKNVKDFDTYLTLARIEDRLLKTSEENAVLQDAVGRAQAEVDAAVAASRANPNQNTYASAQARRAELKSAADKLAADFDRKRVGDWSIAKARQGLADLEAEVGPQVFASLKNAGQEYQNVMQHALQIQVDSGRMSKDLMDRVLESNDFYAPFKVLKHYEDGEGFVKGGSTSRIPSSEQLAKRITGIDDLDVRIGSPTNVAAEQVYKGFILAQKNRKLRELATLSRIDPDGDYVRPLGPDMEPRKGYERVNYFVNGEQKALEVEKSIADSLNGLGLGETDILMRGLANSSKLFKMGATGLNIPFNITNAAFFDPLRLATISKYGFRGPQDLIHTLYEWPYAMWSSARGNIGQYLGARPNDLYEQWIKSGAANSTLARVMTPEAFGKRLPGEGKVTDWMADSNGAGTPLTVASLVSNTLEETTKLLGLQRATRIERLDKLPPHEREKKWNEIVTELRNYAGSPDFARFGVSMKGLNVIMPFLNPRWQGFLADSARLNPFRQGNAKDAAAAWARLGSVVALPSAALAVYNLSTPENERDFKQIPADERLRYFHFPMYAAPDGSASIVDYGKGGHYFRNKDGSQIRSYMRLPKREFAGLVGNTMEDFVDYAKSTDPIAFTGIAANFADNLANVASPVSIQGDTMEERAMSAASGLNPALRIPLEVGTNKNFFTQREIVPRGRENNSPELQFSERTPQIYKDIANAAPDILPESLQSPAKLQHMGEGFTGGFVRQFATPNLSEGNPAGETSPLLNRFFRSERVENEDLIEGADAAVRGRADERVVKQQLAADLAAKIEAATPEQKRALVTDAIRTRQLDEESAQYLVDELQDAARGLNYEDRTIKRSYSVAGGYRARYYLDKLASMPVAARRAYILDQGKKGLLTEDVAKQMAATNP